MKINESLQILVNYGVPEEEMKKIKTKFMATLAIVEPDEIESILKFLEEKGIYINKANQIKVLANGLNEIMKKVSILEELHEVAVYKNATNINLNVIDIYKRIQYCKQYNVPYKKDNGDYEKFLFNQDEWNKIAERINDFGLEDASNKDVAEPVVEKKEENKPYEYDLNAIRNTNNSLQDKREKLVSSVEPEITTNSKEEFKDNFNNDLIYSFDDLFNAGGVLAENEYDIANDEVSYGRKAA